MISVSRRGLVLAAAAASAGCSARAAPAEPSGLVIQARDYRDDRASFRTRLRGAWPSPQPHAMPRAPADVVVMEYPSGDLTLKVWVGLPANASGRRLPVVIFLHGGFAFGGDDFDMARPYLAAGYAVATPILRGENGQSGAYSLFYDEVDDVLAATTFIAAQPFADPARLYLAGHSVGGTMTMLSSMATDRFRAATAFSGSPDQILFTQGEPGIVPFETSDPREFQMRSPLAYPASFKSPTRLFYGAREAFFRQTTPRLATLARQAGREVASAEFPGDHFGAVPAEIEASIAFFRQHA